MIRANNIQVAMKNLRNPAPWRTLMSLPKNKVNYQIKITNNIFGFWVLLRVLALYSTVDDPSNVLESCPTRKMN